MSMDRPRRGMGRPPGGRGGRHPREERPREERPRGERLHPAPYPERPRPSFGELFRTPRPLIGCVHLKPLPGSPGYDGHFLDLLDAALNDARALEEGGATGLIVENFGDAPFYPEAVPPETIAVMTRLVTEIRKVVRIPVGVNVLRNDARAGVAVAAATGAGFVRVNVHTGVMVTDQGVLSGRAFESVRLRELLRSRTLLFADVRVKHAAPLAELDIADEAEDAVLRGRADALIITGAATGRKANLDLVAELKQRLPGTAVLVGSGVTLETIEDVLGVADGCIVGTALKVDGRIAAPVDVRRVRAMAEIAERIAPRSVVERTFERSPGSGDRPERAPRLERGERAERPDRFEPTDVTERTAVPERAGVTERAGRPDRPERARSDRADRGEEPSRKVSWKDVGSPVEGAPAEPTSLGAPIAPAPENPDAGWEPAPWFEPDSEEHPGDPDAPPSSSEPIATDVTRDRSTPAPPLEEPAVAFGRSAVRKRRR